MEGTDSEGRMEEERKGMETKRWEGGGGGREEVKGKGEVGMCDGG